MMRFLKVQPILFWLVAFAVSVALHGAFLFVLLPSALENLDSKPPEMEVASVELSLSSNAPSMENAASRGTTEDETESVSEAETVESENRPVPEKPFFAGPQEPLPPDIEVRDDMPAVYCPPPMEMPPPSVSRRSERRDGVEASQARVESLPQLKKNIVAHYPEQCRKEGIEGEAVLLLKVDASGKVASAEIYKSSGNAALDASAVRAYSKAVFLPGTRGGSPCEMEIYAPVEFRVKNNLRGTGQSGKK